MSPVLQLILGGIFAGVMTVVAYIFIATWPVSIPKIFLVYVLGGTVGMLLTALGKSR